MNFKTMSKADYLLALLFGIIIIVQASQVFFRYILNNSLVWAEEFSRFVFAWIIMIGAVVALREGKHICINLIVDKLPRGFQKYMILVNSSIIAAFSILIAIVGFKLVETTNNTYSSAMLLPLNYVFYAALPVCSLFAIFISLRNVVKNIKSTRSEKERR